ncbi:hypothetical protein ABKN59_004923 [Abortiporus biennis]
MASSNSPREPIIHYDDTLGALFIGLVIAALLTGIGCLQTYIYFGKSGKKDHVFLRMLVLVLWVIDILTLVFGMVGIYFYLITNYTNPTSLVNLHWAIPASVLTTTISDSLVRFMFIYRIWRLSKQTYLGIGSGVFNVVVTATGLLESIRVWQIGKFEELDQIRWIFLWSWITIAIIDTFIAAALCILLFQRKTGFKRTDSQINILMRYSIHTGALTSLCAIGILITYLTMPDNFVYIGIFLPLPQLYHNALLASLNGREGLKEKAQSGATFNSFQLSEVVMTPATPLSDIHPVELSEACTKRKTIWVCFILLSRMVHWLGSSDELPLVTWCTVKNAIQPHTLLFISPSHCINC